MVTKRCRYANDMKVIGTKVEHKNGYIEVNNGNLENGMGNGITRWKKQRIGKGMKCKGKYWKITRWKDKES